MSPSVASQRGCAVQKLGIQTWGKLKRPGKAMKPPCVLGKGYGRAAEPKGEWRGSEGRET